MLKLSCIVLVGILAPSSVLSGCTVNGPCTQASLVSSGCDYSFSKEDIDVACEAAAIRFGEAANKDYRYDKEHMDGGGNLNDQPEYLVQKRLDANRLPRFKEISKMKRVLWPKYDSVQAYVDNFDVDDASMDNFNLTDSCGLRIAMCCYTDTRDGGVLPKNADVCHHDYKTSRTSNHVAHGIAQYDGDSDSDAYCVGFTWPEEEEAHDHHYRGNLLFDISYNTFYEKGYTKGIHGAPMCACVEKMPTVTSAACRKIKSVAQTFEVINDGIGDLLIVQTEGDVIIGDCDTTLQEHYKVSSGQGEQETVSLYHIIDDATDDEVKDCNAATKRFWNENFWVQDTSGNAINQFTEPLSSLWKTIAGNGLYFTPDKDYLNKDKRDAKFRSLFNALPESKKVIYRWCPNCHESHQHLYYRRLSPLPDQSNVNFLDLFLNTWANPVGNKMSTDFFIYNDYDAAKRGTSEDAFQFCNYNDTNVGFPRDCGVVKTDCQWNNYNGKKIPCGYGYAAYSTAFYIPA